MKIKFFAKGRPVLQWDFIAATLYLDAKN